MVHHRGDQTNAPAVEGAGRCLAVIQHQYEFFGKTAHAAVDPWKGANALNGVIHLFTGIDALRQHVRSHVRIHGIITHGGDAPNVVPHYAAAHFLVRAPTRQEVAEVAAQIEQIAQGAALMTGTEVKITQIGPLYEEKIPNYTIGRLFNENLGRMGLTLAPQETEVGMYSTDFGNVSQVVPACGCSFAISEEPIPGHSPEVVAASASELGKGNMLKAAKAMALTALELLTEPALLAAARAEYEEQVQ
jgi:metal-dependent amidase/aminoacylase/carboxypeptidase family protein